MTRWDEIRQVPRGGAELRLCVPPDPKMSRVVRDQVVDFATNLGIVDDDLVDFVTAIGEALANALVHAQATGPIEVSAWIGDGDRLCATIVDNGVGFVAPAPVVEHAALPDAFAECGRGMPIMRRCTDQFLVESEPGKGTMVTLARVLRRKSRDGRSAEALDAPVSRP